MEGELPHTPEEKGTPADEVNTVILQRGGQPPQRARTLKTIIDELNDTYFFSPRRYRLKKEFLAKLRDSRVTGNATLLQDFVLDALLKYVSADDRKGILGMTRANNESALPFAITHRIHNLQKIKLLVEVFKIPINPEWVSLRKDDHEIKLYLQRHTPLYAAVQKKDGEGFKIALKTQAVKLTKYVDLNIVDFIQSKIRENQGRNRVVRYFLNRKWNRMLRATTGQIKKQLLTQAKKENAISAELLALFNQCPVEEIYYALQWHDQDNARLYDKFKRVDLSEYLHISLQMKRITSEEVQFGLVAQRSKVPSSLKIVSHVGAHLPHDNQYNSGERVQPFGEKEPDVRTRFHEYLRKCNSPKIMSMLRQQLLSAEDVQEGLNSQVHIDDQIKEELQDYLARLQNPTTHVRRILSFPQ